MAPVYIVMGVSGSGKTTIGKLLAQELDIPFYDADDYHPQANIDKMASGTPLNDKDRWPWLDVLARNINEWEKTKGAVLACSALKEVYRERLFKDIATSTSLSTGFAPARRSLSVGGKAKQNFVYLKADFETIKERLAKRENHFFDSKLLQSQFDTLEVPEYGIQVDIVQSKDKLIEEIISIIQAR